MNKSVSHKMGAYVFLRKKHNPCLILTVSSSLYSCARQSHFIPGRNPSGGLRELEGHTVGVYLLVFHNEHLNLRHGSEQAQANVTV